MLWQRPIPAQDAGLTFRISRIESENARLRARINQLETQVNRISRSAGGVTTPAAPPPTAIDESAFVGDPMFDRLATLVIETRQDVFALQNRLTELENSLGVRSNPSSDTVESQSE